MPGLKPPNALALEAWRDEKGPDVPAHAIRNAEAGENPVLFEDPSSPISPVHDPNQPLRYDSRHTKYSSVR